MPATQQEATGIVEKVKQRLAEAEREGVHLMVTGSKLDDGCLYIVVGGPTTCCWPPRWSPLKLAHPGIPLIDTPV